MSWGKKLNGDTNAGKPSARKDSFHIGSSSSAGSAERRVPVVMVWDAESTPVAQGTEDETLVDRLNQSLRRFDRRFFLQHIFIAASEEEGFQQRRDVIRTPDCEVTYTRIPKMSLRCNNCERHFRPSQEEPYHHLKRVKDLADRVLVENMESHAHESLGRTAILVVAADKDVSYATGDLKRDRFTILAAVQRLPNDAIPRVATMSCVYWWWNEMQQGLGEPVVDRASFPHMNFG